MNPLVKFTAFLLTNGSRGSFTPKEFCKTSQWLKILTSCGAALAIPVFLILNVMTIWLICCTGLHDENCMQSLFRILFTIAAPATYVVTLFSLFFHRRLDSLIETLPPYQHTWKNSDFIWCKRYLLTSVIAPIIAISIFLFL